MTGGLLFNLFVTDITGSHFYLRKRRCNCWVLLQLKELADEVLLCQTQRLQLTKDLLKYL